MGDFNCAHSFISWIYGKHYSSWGLKSHCFLKSSRVMANSPISFMNRFAVNLKACGIKKEWKGKPREETAYCSNQVLRRTFSIYLVQIKGKKAQEKLFWWGEMGFVGADRAGCKLSSATCEPRELGSIILPFLALVFLFVQWRELLHPQRFVKVK